MFEEPIRFFIDLVRNDRPVLDFLDAKHTFVNRVLAGTTVFRGRRPGTRMDTDGRCAVLWSRRITADGGILDQEFAGTADQSGQARLLGRPASARRDHSAATANVPQLPTMSRSSVARHYGRLWPAIEPTRLCGVSSAF